jgi:hypothetical protein
MVKELPELLHIIVIMQQEVLLVVVEQLEFQHLTVVAPELAPVGVITAVAAAV